MTPRFSIVIPSFNRADYLKRALDSIAAQTFPNYEVIVVDDGSTDHTREVLSAYPNVTVLRQENQGPSAARNAAAKVARSEILAFLDSDDTWAPNHLERQAAVWEREPALGMVEGFFEAMINGKPQANQTARSQAWAKRRSNDSYEGWITGNGDAQLSAVTIRKGVFEEMGGFDTAFRICEDFDLFLRIIARYRTGYIEGEPVSQFRFHASIPNDDMNAAYRNVLLKHLRLIESEPHLFPRINRRSAIQKIWLELSRNSFLSGDAERGRSYFSLAVRRNCLALFSPFHLRHWIASMLPSEVRKSLRTLRDAAKFR